MNKFYGTIGFVETAETAPGVWTEQVTERNYNIDIIRNTRRLQPADQLNDNINIANNMSFIADPYADGHIYAMRYVVFMGTKWKITDVDVQYPRLNLTIGGLYNG